MHYITIGDSLYKLNKKYFTKFCTLNKIENTQMRGNKIVRTQSDELDELIEDIRNNCTPCGKMFGIYQ